MLSLLLKQTETSSNLQASMAGLPLSAFWELLEHVVLFIPVLSLAPPHTEGKSTGVH